MKFPYRFPLLASLVVGMAALPAASLEARQSAQGGQQAQNAPAAKSQQNGAAAQPPAGQPQTQQQPPAGQQAQPGAQPSAQAAASKMDPAEEKAYVDFSNVKADDIQGTISAGEAFLKNYPNSAYAGSVYSRLTRAYMAANDPGKMVQAGEKALQLDPKNVDVLSLMAYVLPRTYNPNELGAADKLTEAQRDAQQALALIPTLPKPANITDEQFAASKSSEEAMCHSGLGLADLQQNNSAGAISELEQAVKLEVTPEPIDQFLLGVAYAKASRWNDAVTPLQQCSTTTSVIADRCKALLDQVKQHATAPATPKPKP